MATCFVLSRDKQCHRCESSVSEILGIKVPDGSTHWEWEFVNNRPVTHYQDSTLRSEVQSQFPSLVNEYGEIGFTCSNGHLNATNFTLQELSKAVDFEQEREEWNEPIGPIEYEASEVAAHMSQSEALVYLRKADLAQSRGEAIFLPRLSAALHRNMMVIPQVQLHSLVVSMPSLLASARDLSERFRTLLTDEQWERFSRSDDGYVWNQSIDAVVCLVHAREIRPVLAIEIDGYGGRIGSNLNYIEETRDEQSTWNMRNKLELMRIIGMECLVLPSTIYRDNPEGIRILTAESGIVETDALTEVVSAVLLDYSDDTLDVPLVGNAPAESVALTSPSAWTHFPDEEARERLRQSAMPSHGIAQLALKSGLSVLEEVRSGLADTISWATERNSQLSSIPSIEMLEQQGSDQMHFLCMTFEYEGNRLSSFIVIMEPFYSNMREISDLTRVAARNYLIHSAQSHLEVPLLWDD